MLTRAAVAKRLGRSIATVRRLEGSELHPWTDERGVHHFDAAEVDGLACRAHDGGLVSFAAGTQTEDQAALREATRAIESLKEQLAASHSARDVAAERSRRLEDQVRGLRETAIEALELVQVLLENETPIAVRIRLRQLRRDT